MLCSNLDTAEIHCELRCAQKFVSQILHKEWKYEKNWGDVKYEVTCSNIYLITVYNRAYKDNKGEALFKEWLRLPSNCWKAPSLDSGFRKSNNSQQDEPKII